MAAGDEPAAAAAEAEAGAESRGVVPAERSLPRPLHWPCSLLIVESSSPDRSETELYGSLPSRCWALKRRGKEERREKKKKKGGRVSISMLLDLFFCSFSQTSKQIPTNNAKMIIKNTQARKHVEAGYRGTMERGAREKKEEQKTRRAEGAKRPRRCSQHGAANNAPYCCGHCRTEEEEVEGKRRAVDGGRGTTEER